MKNTFLYKIKLTNLTKKQTQKRIALYLAVIMFTCLPVAYAYCESETLFQPNYAEILPENHSYSPSSIITDEKGSGYMYDDWKDKQANVPSPYIHSTTIRSVRDGGKEKIEVNICVSVDDSTLADQIIGYNVYSDVRFLFSLPMYNEIPYANNKNIDRVFAILIDQIEDDKGLLICIPVYQDSEERVQEGYIITSGDNLSFFGKK